MRTDLLDINCKIRHRNLEAFRAEMENEKVIFNLSHQLQKMFSEKTQSCAFSVFFGVGGCADPKTNSADPNIYVPKSLFIK